DFWNLVNNRQKISLNLLSNNDVRIEQIDERSVLVVQVPRATRRQRPVFAGLNPLDGTFRRYNEGDYKCSKDEVGRMLADQSEQPADSVILEHFSLDDLHKKSLEEYRNRFASRSPAHPWLAEDDRELLEKLGGWRKDRATGQEGLTVAGLLMFGKEEALRDPHGVPQFNVDYREHLSDDPEVRWTDRITLDGTWPGNVFQFYQRVITRLLSDLKLPFQMGKDLFRKDETIVHEAIREAFVNALIHADYRGQGGVVIQKYRDRFELSNPGSLLLSIDQIILQGGISECRNKSLQLMFQQIGGGEKAGSGIDKIRQGWASQKWRSPLIQEQVRPDRVRLILPMVSLLPEESLERLQNRFGTMFKRLNPLEVQALVTAEIEGSVSNARMRQITNEHPTDLTKLLQGLAVKRLLHQVGQKRGSTYKLPGPTGHSSHKGDSSHKPAEDSSHKLESLTEEQRKRLNVLAVPASMSSRLPTEETRKIILQLCGGYFFTAVELGELMSRNPNSLRSRFLTPLVEEGLLVRKFPDEPNRPDQAYTTAVQENDS
ncbi:MAG: hypothetical protein J3T61_11405, partial [Candidatus Brocadiales bacterium]|nr:hypothetical protein [Candidatus Bathyanammoxibius sp.]